VALKPRNAGRFNLDREGRLHLNDV